MERAAVYLVILAALLVSSSLLIADVPSLLGPSQVEKEVIFSSLYNDIARDMAMDSHGNIVLVGGRWDTHWSFCKFYVLKTSPEGQLEWSKIWNVTRYDMVVGVEIDSQDNIIVAGVTGINQDESNGTIIKLDSEGDEVWQTEFPGIRYNWHWWPQYSDCFGLQVDTETDNIYVAGSLVASRHQSMIAALNSSGAELWQTTWDGPSDSNGTDVTTMWFSPHEGVIISGGVYESNRYPEDYMSFYMTAIAANGTARWNRTSSLIWTGLETTDDEFVTATASWRGYNQVTRYRYNDGGLGGCTVDAGQYNSIRIQGFCTNGSQHIIGLGRVESLIAAAPVTRGFSARFQGPQAPQTLIVSCNSTGELEWYDFLVLGTMSEPCGAMFDSEGRMIIVGHTCAYSLSQNDFFIVFGFQHTPFPPDSQILLLGFFPIFNIIVPGFLSELRKLHENGKSFLSFHASGMTYRRAIWRLFQIESIILILFILTISSGGGGGPPSPIASMPRWMQTLLFSVPLGIAVLGLLYLVMRVRSGQTAKID